MKKIILFMVFYSLFYLNPGFAQSPGSEIKRFEGIKAGASRNDVRARFGLPFQMKADIWKYKDFFVIFESNSLKCIVSNKCFGKWSDCHSFLSRSPECVLISE
ncbi:MAG: hypothetical protein H6681_05505 [Desulfobacteraceae bacterium]|nr:hypothetical protein [Desulfobacteraceae bacterium]